MFSTEWAAVSARIASLVDASNLFLRSIATGENDQYGMSGELLRNARQLVGYINGLNTRYADELPESASRCLFDWVERLNQRFPPDSSGLPGFAAAVILLASFRAEFTHVLVDTEAVALSLVARAFAHLKRSIVADQVVRSLWQTAFNEGELACEKAGACHLLIHGIWAFKTSAEGERTDLVLNEPLSGFEEVQRTSTALVLTEWKVVRSDGEVDVKANQALRQARLYSAGILAGSELASRRYLVMVSGDRLPSRAHQQDGLVTYEYVNIAVSPSVPSAA
jgi:hypothetical protein